MIKLQYMTKKGVCIMAVKYKDAHNRATRKYDEAHYKRISAKIPLDIYEKLVKCDRYDNNNQIINLLILEEIEKDMN